MSLAASCKKDVQPELPPKELIIDIMTELYIAEAPMARVPQDLRDSIGYDLRERIARDFDMDADEMARIVAEVQSDPDLHIEVCDSILKRLEVRQNELEKKN